MSHINLRNFDLNLLKAFSALERERSVTGAAKSLNIGQPAMSHALARLRYHLNDKLFVRSGTGMTPTPLAAGLIEPVRVALAQIDAAFGMNEALDPKTSTTRFKIGMTDVMASIVTSKLSLALNQQAPQASVAVLNADRYNAPAMLESMALDLAIGLFPNVPDWLEKEMLFQDDFVCLYDSTLINMGKPISLSDYASHPHVLTTLQGDDRGFADTELEKANLTRHVAVTVPFFLLASRLVNELPLIATLPRHLAQACMHVPSTCLSELPFPSPRLTISMVWHRRNARSAGVIMVRNLLKQALA
jgi:LysR family transcriptional regulator, mexEF-oprN operon transcriptional activator